MTPSTLKSRKAKVNAASVSGFAWIGVGAG
jgi:hypothetical protein